MMLCHQTDTGVERSHNFRECCREDDMRYSNGPHFLYQTAVTMTERGEVDTAIDSYRKLLSIDEKNIEASYNLGCLLLGEGCFEEAQSVLEYYLKHNPENGDALCVLGNVYCKLNRYDLAVHRYKQWISFQPDNYHAYRSIGDVYQNIGRPDEAAYAYVSALKLQPDDPDIIASLAMALTRLGKKEKALICFQKALLCRPDDYTLYNRLGTVLEKCNRLVEARKAVQKSLSLCPKNYGALVNLATIEYREGNFSAALQMFQQMNLKGRTYEAAAMITQLKGLALDKLGRYTEAFACFQKSNQFDMQTPIYKYLRKDYGIDLKKIEGIRTCFSKKRISSWVHSDFKAPIFPPVFLVGFPRSGTTLMEQVLNSHSQMVTLDERTPLGELIEDFTTAIDQGKWLDSLSDSDMNDYRETYFELLKIRTDSVGIDRLIIDKLPLNILYLPIIYKFFPDAKIIVALRHPLDCILSNFIQRFKLNKKMMNFLTLEKTAQFYDLTMGMYLQFRESVPLQIHEIKYEMLTENLNGETKKLSDFLDVEWSPGMIHYYKKATHRVINTPSYIEVIKPIHRKAVYRWKNYEKQLAPIIPVVRNYIDQFGYDLEV